MHIQSLPKNIHFRKRKACINIVILDVLRHEIKTSYLWPLKLQEVLRVVVTVSFQIFINAVNCYLGKLSHWDHCTGIFSFLSRGRQCSGVSVLYDILWSQPHAKVTLCVEKPSYYFLPAMCVHFLADSVY